MGRARHQHGLLPDLWKPPSEVAVAGSLDAPVGSALDSSSLGPCNTGSATDRFPQLVAADGHVKHPGVRVGTVELGSGSSTSTVRGWWNSGIFSERLMSGVATLKHEPCT